MKSKKLLRGSAEDSPKAASRRRVCSQDAANISHSAASGFERDVVLLARMGYSVRAIADLTCRPQFAVRDIMRRLGLTSASARKWMADEVKTSGVFAVIEDLELEAQRGGTFYGGYPYEIRPGDYYENRPKHGPVRIYRPGPDGQLVLVEEVQVQ